MTSTALQPLDLHTPLFEELQKLAPPGITEAFRFMQIAEEEIEDAIQEHPDQAEALDRAFPALCPRPEYFTSEHLYRSHVRELLARARRGDPLEPGTAAECCSALAQLSSAAPLKHLYTTCYAILFTDAFGEEQARATIGDRAVERAQEDRTQPRVEEILAELTNATRDDDR